MNMFERVNAPKWLFLSLFSHNMLKTDGKAKLIIFCLAVWCRSWVLLYVYETNSGLAKLFTLYRVRILEQGTAKQNIGHIFIHISRIVCVCVLVCTRACMCMCVCGEHMSEWQQKPPSQRKQCLCFDERA